jgi:3-oxoacyl-[acyl-carrier-protein] synthase-3
MEAIWPIVIRGSGSYVPERVVDNQHFVDYLDTTEEWITTRTGIRERHWASPEQATSDLAAEAARRAIEDAGLEPSDIDTIICATATGDHAFPATACFVQAKLGINNIPAFDIGAACAGFLYATTVAASLLATGAAKNLVVIGAETLSRYGDPEDRSTVILFGDGAGAVVLSRSDDPERGVLHHEWGVDATKVKHIWAPAGGSRLFASETTVAERLHYLHMKGREVFKFAVLKMQTLIDRSLEKLSLTPDDLKLVIPHQSNMRIIQSMQQRMGLPDEKITLNIDRFGNTSAASIPLALDAALRDGTLKRGDLVLLIAIGAGLTYGNLVMRL